MNGTSTSEGPRLEVQGGVPQWGESYPDLDSPGVRANLDVIAQLPPGQPEHSTQQDWRKPQASKPRKATKRRDEKPIPEEVEIEAAQEVDGDEELPSAALVGTIESFLRRYAILPIGMYLVIALWAIGTYFTVLFDAYGYLGLTSPTPRCGKTRLQELIEQIAWRPLKSTCTSESSLFRMLTKSPGYPAPLVIIDEAEALSNTKDPRSAYLNQILNSGYRKGQQVPRTTPDGKGGFKVERFDTFGPKCIAAIGPLPPTLQDRSIIVPMQRRAPNEHIERFLFGATRRESASIRNSLRRDMNEMAVEVSTEYLKIADLPFLSDRDAEISIPLFAICRVFAPDRETELRETLARAFGEKAGATEDDSLSQRLLADVKSVWPDGEENASTTQLLANLKTIDDAPWVNGYELNPRKMARMLAGFGIKSRTVRIGEKTAKGYFRSSFEPAWGRYLSLPEGPVSVTTSQPALTEAAKDEPCDVVTDKPLFQRERGTDEPDFGSDFESDREV